MTRITLLTLVAVCLLFFAGFSGAGANEFFQVDFAAETPGEVPRTTVFSLAETADLPTRLSTSAPGQWVVAENVAGLARALVGTFPALNAYDPSAFFDPGRNLDLEGVFRLSFEAAILEHEPGTDKGMETVLTVVVSGPDGRNIGLLSFSHQADQPTGNIAWVMEKQPHTRLGHFTPGVANRFDILFDTANKTLEVRLDDVTAHGPVDFDFPPVFRALRMSSGWAAGGRDGRARVAIANVRIADDSTPPAQATLPRVTQGPTTPPGLGAWDGVTPTVSLKGPYEDRIQQAIPFGRISYQLAPWRAYMDTHPAHRYRRIQGLNWSGLQPEENEPVISLLGELGWTSVRVEVGWGSMTWEDPGVLSPGTRHELARILPLFRRHGLRPLILLNANSGGPVPSRDFEVTLLEDAPVEARELWLDLEGAPDFRLGRTGLRGQEYHIAYPLFVAREKVGDRVRVELSAPLKQPLKAGRLRVAELRFAPMSGDIFADGRPNPDANETLEGWRRYIAGTLSVVGELIASDDPDDAGFDVEVWNEYSFGSHFLYERAYYQPERAFRSSPSYGLGDKICNNAEVLLPITIQFVRENFPGVRVISGFANQRPWDNGTESWPGLDGNSRHYYSGAIVADTWGGMDGLLTRDNAGLPQSSHNHPPLDALGGPQERDPDWLAKTFVPEHLVSMVELWNYGYKTELMTRDIQPFPGPFAIHHRFSHPGTGQPPGVWMTETNFWRQPFADFLRKAYDLPRGDPRLTPVMNRLAAKALVRQIVFLAHKGVETINFFTLVDSDESFGLMADAFFRALRRERGAINDVTREAAGPAMNAVGRVSRLLSDSETLDATRAVRVETIIEHQPRLVFKGNGTETAPDRYHVEDLAILPFQRAADSFAIGFYVVTRNLLHGWDPDADLLDPARYDLPEQRFDVTLGNLRGMGAQLEIFDPIANRTWPLKPLAGDEGTLTVSLPAVDYPRFLLVKEDQPGPLVVAPRIARDDNGKVTVVFSTNVDATAVVSHGAFPERAGRGEWTRGMEKQETVSVELGGFREFDAVRISLIAGDLRTDWPRWDHDVAGALEFEPPHVGRVPDGFAFPPDLAAGPTPAFVRVAGNRPEPRLRRIAGSIEILHAVLPVATALDSRFASATELGGFPAWQFEYALNGAAHPDLKGEALQPRYAVWPLDDGFQILTLGPKDEWPIFRKVDDGVEIE